MRSVTRGSKGVLVFGLLVFNLGVAAVIAKQWFGWPARAQDDEEAGYGDLLEEGGLEVGDVAPDFTLPTADGKSTATLSSFRNTKPVVLIFGSYSCPMLRRQLGGLRGIYERYRDRAEFLFVYVQEAHPDGANALPENDYEGIRIPEHETLEDRLGAAGQCIAALDCEMPMLVDTMDNRVRTEYSAWPVRLYVIGEDGRIAHKGSATPQRFSISELLGLSSLPVQRTNVEGG